VARPRQPGAHAVHVVEAQVASARTDDRPAPRAQFVGDDLGRIAETENKQVFHDRD